MPKEVEKNKLATIKYEKGWECYDVYYKKEKVLELTTEALELLKDAKRKTRLGQSTMGGV